MYEWNHHLLFLLRVVELLTKKFTFVLPALYRKALGLAVCTITALLLLERGLDEYRYSMGGGQAGSLCVLLWKGMITTMT